MTYLCTSKSTTYFYVMSPLIVQNQIHICIEANQHFLFSFNSTGMYTLIPQEEHQHIKSTCVHGLQIPTLYTIYYT